MLRVTLSLLFASLLVPATTVATGAIAAKPVDTESPATSVAATDASSAPDGGASDTPAPPTIESLPLLPTTWGELIPAWAAAGSRYEGRKIIGVGSGSSLRSAAAVALAGAARAREARLREENPTHADSDTSSDDDDTASEAEASGKHRKAEPGEEVEREPGAVARVTQATWELGRVAIHARVMRSRHRDPPSKETVETTGLKLEDGNRSFVLFVTRTDRLRGGEARETVSIESTSTGLSFEDLLASLRDAGVKLRVHQTSVEFFVEAVYE